MTPLTVAIIGAGKLGQVHTRHWQSLPDVQVAGIVDMDAAQARSLGDTVKNQAAPIATAVTLEELLASIRPDIIDICTPTPTHRPLIAQAADARSAVFVEKPLARTLEDCDAIVETVRQSGITLMPGHVVRWFPAFARAKTMIDAGAVGTPVTVRTARLAAFPQRVGAALSWYGDPAQSGGVVLDALLHDFDWLRWCFGPVMRVFAKGLTFDPKHQGKRDYALVTLRFASGVVGHVAGSWAHARPMHTTFEICGDAGMLEFDSDTGVSLTLTQPQARLAESPLAAQDDPYLGELRAFADAVRAQVLPPVTVEEGREAVRIALAALDSIQTGRVVSL